MDTISPTATTPVSTVPLTASPLPQPSQPLNVQTVQTQSIIYAGFGRRFVAWLIDYIIMVIIYLILSIPNLLLSGIDPNSVIRPILALIQPIFQWIISIVYVVYFIGSRGQTPGKMAVGIKVVKIDTHTSPGYINAFLREVVGKIISSLVICLGFFWMLWDKNKQTWHDKIANTIVIKL